MYISDVHDYSQEETPAAKEFLAKGRREKIKSAVEEMINDEYDALEDDANEFISRVAASRAEKFLERVLRGDEEAAMALLGDDTGGSRYRQCGYDNGKSWAILIHGTLSESGGVKLRRKIVEANQDLLKDERAKDLQSIVDGLTEQVSKLEAEVKSLRGEY